jgi:hypothetical protein
MPTIIEIPNYFEPFTNTVHDVESGSSVLHWLENSEGSRTIDCVFENDKWVSFYCPTIIQINGESILQKDYESTIIKGNDVVTLVTVIGTELVILVIAIVISVAVSVIVAKKNANVATQPRGIGSTPEAAPTFTLAGQQNRIKLGQAIPSHFGTVKNWPDYAARPYNEYEGNNQYQYSLYCLGQGSYQASDFRIEDTAIASYQEVEVEIYLPDEPVTLFRDAVITSREVASVELFGVNEPEYTGNVGPFIVNDSFTQIDRLSVDMTLPKGLYKTATDGSLRIQTLAWLIEYQQIDDNGDAVGDWEELNATAYSFAYVSPYRSTHSINVPLGRYQVRGARTTNKNLANSSGNDLYWESVRGFFPNVLNYGDVTIIAVKALATNNLNDNSRSIFNLRQTRMLPIYNIDSQEWSERVPTTNPVDAIIQIFKAPYGGNYPDAFLNLTNLIAIRNKLAEAGSQFNYSFENATNVWDAGRLALSTGRCVPLLNGSSLSAAIDEQESIPHAIFTPDNIIKDSFVWEIRFRKENDNDGLEIEFVDDRTWKPRTLLCTVDGEAGLSPRRAKLKGVTDANLAYREGLYLRAKEVFQKESFTFSTGLEGHIPSLNSLIGIVHDLPKWGSSGFLVAKQGNSFALDRTVAMEEGLIYEIGFNAKDGTFLGPYLVETQAGDNDTVICASAIPDDSFFSRGANQLNVAFVFGIQNKSMKLARVVSLTPKVNNEIKVVCVTNEDRIYNYDTETAPALPVTNTRVINDLPVLSGLRVEALAGQVDRIKVSWNPAEGFPEFGGYINYRVEISYNNEDWTLEDATFLHSSTVDYIPPNLIYIRVSVTKNNVVGPYSYYTGFGGNPTVPDEVTGLKLGTPFVGNFVYLEWEHAEQAAQYLITIKDENDNVIRIIEYSYTIIYNYTAAQALIDFGAIPRRTMKFSVGAFNPLGTTPATTELTVSNPKPEQLRNLSIALLQNLTTTYEILVTFEPSPDTDLFEYVVWGDDVEGFDSHDSLIIYNGLLNTISISIPKAGLGDTYYIKAAALDLWGDDYNISLEISLTLP